MRGSFQPEARSSVEGRPHSGFELMRHVTAVGVSGLVAGIVVGGVGGRLFMRVAGAAAPDSAQGALTEAGFTVGEVTASGTFGLISFLGVLVGVVGAVLYAVLRPWLNWARTYRGALFGVVLFAVASATSDVMNPDNIDFVILGNGPLVVSMIVALFLSFGVVIDSLYRLIDSRLPAVTAGVIGPKLLYGSVTGFGLLATIGLMPFLLFSTSQCECDPPVLASASVVVAAVGTLLWWVAGISPRFARSAGVARVLGFGGLTGATIFGLIRAVTDAAEILA